METSQVDEAATEPPVATVGFTADAQALAFSEAARLGAKFENIEAKPGHVVIPVEIPTEMLQWADVREIFAIQFAHHGEVTYHKGPVFTLRCLQSDGTVPDELLAANLANLNGGQFPDLNQIHERFATE